MKATCASRAFTLASRFRTKKSLSIQNLTYMMLKTRLPFLYASTSLDTKTSTIASNRNFKAVCRFVVLLLSSFCGFSIFAAGFSFAFGNFVRYCNVLLNAPLSDRDKKKKKCLKWVTFPGKSWSVVIDARRSYRPIGLRFQEAR